MAFLLSFPSHQRLIIKARDGKESKREELAKDRRGGQRVSRGIRKILTPVYDER